MPSIQYIYDSYLIPSWTFIRNQWDRLSAQQKLITGIALAALGCVIWIAAIYVLHRKVKYASSDATSVKTNITAQSILNENDPLFNSSKHLQLINTVDKTGKKYEGYFYFEQSKCNGFGTVTLPNADVFQGEFSHGYLKGLGIKKIGDNTYIGQFDQNELNGSGRIKFASGDVYDGIFEDSQLKSGKKFLANGDIYEGAFKDNELDGKGKVFLYQSKEDLNGTFVKGKLHGDGIHSSILLGWKYEGEFREGKVQGPAKVTRHGNTYSGIFFEGFLNDTDGEIKFANGDSYRGSVVRDAPDGLGKFTKADGTVLQGRFKGGNFIG